MLALLLLVALTAQMPAPAPTPAVPATAQPAPAVPSHLDAVELVTTGEWDEALRTFQRIAAANPNDHGARLWIARLHVMLEHPDRAESVYRSVALEDPDNVPALVGIGEALLERNEYEDALDVLADAERLAPQDPAVLAAIGRAHAQAGRTTQAIVYLERAVALAPTEDHRAALHQVRLTHEHRFESTALVEQFDRGVDDTRGTDLSVNLRLRDSLRLLGRGQLQRKFGFTEERGGVGLEWRWKPSTSIHAQVLVGPDNVVLGEIEGYGEINHVAGPARWMLGVRYVDFSTAKVTVVSPGVIWQATDRLVFDLRYAFMTTDRATRLSAEHGHSVRVDGAYGWSERLSFLAGYAGGVDRFDALSVDRIGDFRANTASVGVRYALRPLTSLTGLYEQSWRDDGFDMKRATFGITQRF